MRKRVPERTIDKQMALYFQEFGESGTPLIMVHGLFGSSVNWRGIARQLADRFHIYALDLRNHGKSPHMETMRYADMALDLARFMDSAGLEKAHILGHSMGGKAAMVAALIYPARFDRMMVLDIAPVSYTHTYDDMIDAMLSVDLSSCSARADVEAVLRETIPDDGTRLFIMQNVVAQEGELSWRLNLPVIKEYMSDIIGFPSSEMQGKQFEGPVQMIYGENSDYVKASAGPVVRDYFPNSGFQSIENAGHWLHVDQPEALIEMLREFLS